MAAKKTNLSSATTSTSYKEEVRGKNCGLRGQGTYVSTTDDAVSCKAKCSADENCLAYTTYNTKCAIKCLHYTHTCDKEHQAVTQCSGDIVSYSKVKEATPPVQSVPQSTSSQTMNKDVTVAHVTTAKNAKGTKNDVKTSTKKATGGHTDAQVGYQAAMASTAKIPVKSASDREKTTTIKGTAHPKEVAKMVHPVKAKATATKVVPVKGQATKSHHVPVAKTSVPGIAVPIANVTAADGTALGKVPSASKKKKEEDSTKKDCACVHRHGKKVCHCQGEAAQRNEMKAVERNEMKAAERHEMKAHNSKKLRRPSK